MKYKIKFVPEKDDYSKEEFLAIFNLCRILGLNEFTDLTVMIRFINRRLLNEYAPKGAVEFDSNTGEFKF